MYGMDVTLWLGRVFFSGRDDEMHRIDVEFTLLHSTMRWGEEALVILLYIVIAGYIVGLCSITAVKHENTAWTTSSHSCFVFCS